MISKGCENGTGIIFKILGTDSPVVEQSIGLASGKLQLYLRGTPGARYEIQTAADLSAENWATFNPPIFLDPQGGSFLEVPGMNEMRFYRVRMD